MLYITKDLWRAYACHHRFRHRAAAVNYRDNDRMLPKVQGSVAEAPPVAGEARRRRLAKQAVEALANHGAD